MRPLTRWPTRPSLGWSLLASALLLLALPAAAQRPASGPEDTAVALTDGAVVDPARAVAYLARPEGGIDAVELARGTVLWTTAEGAKPLFAAGDLLLAQRPAEGDGALALAVLDAGHQGRRLRAVEIPLGEGVDASLRDTPGRTFRARAFADGDQVVVAWRASARGPGIPPAYLPAASAGEGPTTDAPATRRAEGAARLDLTTGAVAPLVRAKAAAALSRSFVDLDPDSDDAAAEHRYASVDDRDLLASEGNWPSYRWSIYDRESGARLGQLERPVPVAPFLVKASTLLYEVRPSLRQVDGKWVEERLSVRALDLGSGAELWSRELLDPEYRGPFPP
jgi:hypothetical protein